MDSQSQDHPLLLELNSLKSAVARFQDEAHASAVKLQRHSLDRANTYERAAVLERENGWLKAEIAVLRASPTAPPFSNSTAEQVQQLTLSLRRLSEKLTLTEDALLSKTTELAQANADLLKARLAVENAYELSARVRGREETAKIREHELERRLKSAEEEKKISEVAVGEYANLVRSMEARMCLGSTSTLVTPNDTKIENDLAERYSVDSSGVTLANSLVEGKLGLKRLLFEFQCDTEELQRQLGQLRGELEVLKSNHEAERKGTHVLHLELAKAQAELHMLRIDDNTAARMVSRYMQFSQTSTNTLQSTLSAVKTRHAATLSTLTSTSYALASNLRSAENTIERLRTSLDELGRDMMKETYGRRREVALRVRLLGREEKMLEGLRRWLRKGEEAISDAGNESQSRIRAALLGMTQDARILLEGLDDGLVTDSASLSGSLARVVLAQALVDGLVDELKTKTARRMDLEKVALPEEQDTSLPIVTLNGSDINQRLPVSDGQQNSANVFSSSAFAAPLEVITVKPLDLELDISKKAQPSTTILVDTISSTNTLDIASPTTKGDIIPSDSTPLTDDTATAANEHSPPPFHTHQSDTLNPNQASAAISPESPATVESLPIDVQLTPLSSTPVPDIMIDVDVAQPPHIDSEITNSVLEEAGTDKHSDLVIIQTDVALRNIDLPVGSSSEPAVVGPGPIIADDSTSSALPSSPPNLFSVVDPAVPTNSVTSLPITSSATRQLPVLAEKESPTPHPLLGELAKISHRYDDFQRSFRDCHLALEGLKASLGPSSATSSNHEFNPSFTYTSRPTGVKPPELILTPIIPIDILHAAVSRLDDYTEDVRVEVEIRISDEEVLAKGYEVLLCVPGALYSSSTPVPSLLSPLQSDQHQHHHQFRPAIDYEEDQSFVLDDSSSIPPTQSELEIQVQAFVTGTDPSVTKACEGFTKKLEDVQHDIAVLKRAIHDPDPAKMTMVTGDGHEFSSQTLTAPEAGGGSGWTSWIRSSSGPSTPASATMASGNHFGGLGSSPTFGRIMTSPHRLKHSPSLNLNAHGNHKNRSSTTFVNGDGSSWVQGGGGGGSKGGEKDDILGRLGLRVPMPIFDSVHQPLPPLSSSSVSIGGWGWNGLSPTMPTPIKKKSVSSTMYMLGLGASPMMTAARSRGTSNLSTWSQKGDDPVVGDGDGVESVNEVQLKGPISLVEVGRGDKLISIETTDERDADVE